MPMNSHVPLRHGLNSAILLVLCRKPGSGCDIRALTELAMSKLGNMPKGERRACELILHRVIQNLPCAPGSEVALKNHASGWSCWGTLVWHVRSIEKALRVHLKGFPPELREAHMRDMCAMLPAVLPKAFDIARKKIEKILLPILNSGTMATKEVKNAKSRIAQNHYPDNGRGRARAANVLPL